MNKFLSWFFAIYWVVMGIMSFTSTVTFTPFFTGCACMVASVAFWNDLF